MAKVILPDLGEEVKQATISYWYLEEGDEVKEGDNIVEISTDKATFNVQAPVSGILSEVLFAEGETVQSNEVIAVIEEQEATQEEA